MFIANEEAKKSAPMKVGALKEYYCKTSVSRNQKLLE
jgi:hypothetical protein